jgi:hypothetical protein
LRSAAKYFQNFGAKRRRPRARVIFAAEETNRYRQAEGRTLAILPQASKIGPIRLGGWPKGATAYNCVNLQFAICNLQLPIFNCRRGESVGPV